MKSIRNVDVLYTIHEKSRVLEECICRVESACDTGHFESVDSALRTKPELRAALGTYIRQMLALLRMLTPQAWNYSRDVKLEQCSLYSEGFDRLGCIGCPLAREQNRRREFSRWPKFYEQYLRTFDRMLERRRQCGDAILDYASTAEIWMEWWLSDHVQETSGAGQLSLYEL